jgi:signal transduction histidine kinase/FixJ family two-component response regulator
MNLRVKISLLMGGVCVVMMLALAFVHSYFILPSFERLEEADARRNVGRAFDALAVANEEIVQKLADWAGWDDTYKFIEDHNQEYIDSNLEASSLEAMNIDLVTYLDANGNVRWSAWRDREGAMHGGIVAGAEHQLREGAPLRDLPTLKSHASGVMRLDAGAMLAASRPITDTAYEQPARGTLIFGRWVSDALTARIGERLHMDVMIEPVGANPVCTGRRLNAGEDRAIWFKSVCLTRVRAEGNQVASSTVVADLEGKPALTVIVTQPREVLAHGQNLARTILLFGLLASTAIFLCVHSVLHRWVLGPLTRMQREVVAIGHGEIQERVTVRGKDEIATLALGMNNTLDALAAARETAEQASAAKGLFLANMSHEIRTPMTAILGYADVLTDSSSSREETERAAQVLRRSGRHLLKLINDILDVSKIEAGRLEMETLPCSPVQIVSDVHTLLGGHAREKRLAFTLDVEGRVPASIRSDPTRLRQALINLVGNAVKFTDKGSVRIGVAYDEEKCLVIFRVSDDGIGMSSEQLRGLFRAFTQADASMTRRFGGSGLGLVISRHIAQKLGGDLTVDSRPGEGSTFTLTVGTGGVTPTEFVDASEVRRQSAPVLPASESVPTVLDADVLLVDDAVENQRLLSLYLKKIGGRVDIAGNGQEGADMALRRWKEGKPYAVVLMDMQMPLMDGYTAAALMREKGYTLPVIALTAHAMRSDLDRAIQAGCNAYMTKPVERASFITEVWRWAELGKSQTAAKAQSERRAA